MSSFQNNNIYSASNRKKYQGVGLVHEADNLTTICELPV
jgi:hypothetical protein